MRACVVTLLFGVALASPSGCTADEPGEKKQPIDLPGDPCYDIIEVCHDVDYGDPGELHSCHELGHRYSEPECAAERDRCRGICLAAYPEAGEPDGAVPPDAASDGAVPRDATVDGAGPDVVIPHPVDGAGGAPAEAGPPSRLCIDLSNICHFVDPGSGPLHECHEIGHDGPLQRCVDNWDRCKALCEDAM